MVESIQPTTTLGITRSVLDARSRVIANVSTASLPGEAVNYGQALVRRTDNLYSANGGRITETADPVNSQDVVTLNLLRLRQPLIYRETSSHFSLSGIPSAALTILTNNILTFTHTYSKLLNLRYTLNNPGGNDFK